MTHITVLDETSAPSTVYPFHRSALAKVRNGVFWEMESALGRLIHFGPPQKMIMAGRQYLNLGSCDMYFDDMVNADFFAWHRILQRRRLPDWMLDLRRPWKCPHDLWRGILCEHTIEHLSYEHALLTMREMFRTLQPGGRVRISVPDIRKFVMEYLNGNCLAFPSHLKIRGAQIISLATQCWDHVSTWDGELLSSSLASIGFQSVDIASYREGGDRRLLKDTQAHQWESVYVEGKKA
jgi:hypothetical protein